MSFTNPVELHLAGLSTELSMLVGATLLGLLQLFVAARMGNGQRGLKWNVGARDEAAKPVGKVAGRLERAFRNFMETYPFFAAAVIVAALAGRHDWATVWGSEIYLAGRIVYVPLYGFGVPVIRTLVWLVATLALLLIAVAIVWPGIWTISRP
ncbi:MAG TPA: MAPEG family protein [Rhizomicrobium sp.]|nr:MAPEG family protein [Rhizomicrobium sp.]